MLSSYIGYTLNSSSWLSFTTRKKINFYLLGRDFDSRARSGGTTSILMAGGKYTGF